MYSAVGERTADEVHAINCEEAEAMNNQMQFLSAYASSKHALQVCACRICVVAHVPNCALLLTWYYSSGL